MRHTGGRLKSDSFFRDSSIWARSACIQAQSLLQAAIAYSGPEQQSGSGGLPAPDTLPQSGPPFPNPRKVKSKDRANEIRQRWHGMGIKGVSLHSYRHAWAERARKAGYPRRPAEEALGHNSKAVSVKRSSQTRWAVELRWLHEPFSLPWMMS